MSSRRSKRVGLAFSLKMSLWNAIFFAVGSMVLFGVAYYLMGKLLDQREREIVLGRIQEYRAWYEEGGLRAISARFDAQSDTAGDAFFTRIIGRRNQVLFLSIPGGVDGIDFQQFGAAPLNQKTPRFFASGQEKNYWTIGAALLPGGIILQVGKNSTRSREFLTYFRSVFVKFVAPILLVGIVIGGLLTFRGLLPIRRLVQTVRDILKTGEMSTRVPVRPGGGELNELMSLFNEMLARNQSLIQAMHESLDNVAHDLRTPMTRLRGMAEMAMQDVENPHACQEALGDCMEESERVLTMLNTLMDVAEAETGAMRLDREPLSAPEVIRNVMELYEIVAEEKQIAISADLPDSLGIMADRTRVQQVIGNLLDNAIKYGDSGQKVEISARREDDFAVISVADQGMGIAPGEMEKIWNRLYRTDRSRSRRGLGLGLSFVRAIVQAHGGDVHVESELNKGSTFIVRLPGA